MIARGALVIWGMMLASTLAVVAVGRAMPLHTQPVAFETNIMGNREIYVMDAGRSLRYNLTQHEAYDARPVWSPNGQHVAFVSDRDGPISLYLLNIHDGKVRQLIDRRQMQFQDMRWGSDNRTLFFNSRQAELLPYRVDTLTGAINRVEESDLAQAVRARGDDPAANVRMSTQRGRYTVFMAYREGVWGIYITDDNRQNARNMLSGTVDVYARPSLSPDGRSMLFVSTRDGNREIYLLDTACAYQHGDCEQHIHRLTYNAFWDGNPVWLSF